MLNVQFTACKINTQDFYLMENNRLLNLPDEEPMGTLVTSKGHKVYIEFVYEGKGLYDEDSVIKKYHGPGIYLLDYYQDGCDHIPIWVVLRKESNLTVGETKRILQKIEQILLSDEYRKGISSWDL